MRYFRDSQPEEYSIKIGPDGSELAFHHRLAEDAAGATLSKEEAVAKAEKYLREVKKLDLGQWSLVEANSDKRIHRTDHELAWQQRTPIDSGSTSSNDAVSHAYVRIKVAVLGDEVVDYRGSYYSKPEAREELEAKEGGTTWMFIKIPTSGAQARRTDAVPHHLQFAVPILLYGGLGITAIVLFQESALGSRASNSWRRLALGALGALAYGLIVGFGATSAIFLELLSDGNSL